LETAAAEPEVLAHHFTQAGLTDAAIEWLGKAGEGTCRARVRALLHLGIVCYFAGDGGRSV